LHLHVQGSVMPAVARSEATESAMPWSLGALRSLTRLGVHQSQVSRDERNEYFGTTLERTIKVDALNVDLHKKVEVAPPTQELSIA
jgi:hypothetical protein